MLDRSGKQALHAADGADAAPRHDVFISYSRKDAAFAAALEAALERFTPPKGLPVANGLPVAHRRLDAFRDAEDFTGTEYFGAVDRHLRNSRKLVVVCSPNARQSRYVDDEIARFAEARPAGEIIPVLIAGLPNNEVTTDTQSQAAFPDSLCRLLELPLAADYRGFDPASDRIASKRWWPAWYKLLADICNCSRAEIEERDRKRRFRRAVTWTAAASVVIMLVGGLWRLAEDQRRHASSFDLAQKAMASADSDPELGTSQALEAVALSPSRAATTALRVNLARLPALKIRIAEGYDLSAPIALAFSPDGRQMLVADRQAKVRVLDRPTGGTRLELAGAGDPIIHGAWSPDGTLIAAVDEKRRTFLFEAATGRKLRSIDGELHWRPSSGEGRSAVLMHDRRVGVVALDAAAEMGVLREVAPPGYAGPRVKEFEPWLRALDPNGDKIAVLLAEREPAAVVIADLRTGTVGRVEIKSPQGVQALAWSPDGRFVAASALFGFAVIDAGSGKVVFTEDSGTTITVEDVSFSPDGSLLATTDRDGVTSIWTIAQRKKTATFAGEADRAFRPTFSRDGRYLSVIYANGRGRVFSVDKSPKGGMARLENTWGDISSVGFTPDAGMIAAVYERGVLAFWDVPRWFPERRIPIRYQARYRQGTPEGLNEVRFGADPPVIAREEGGRPRSWSIATGAELPEAPANLSRITDLAVVSRNGNVLRQAGQDVLIAAEARVSSIRLPHSSDDVRAATFSHDGQCVLTASRWFRAGGEPAPDANVVRLWDTETGLLLREWRFDVFGPDIAFFADRERVVALYDHDAFVFRSRLCASPDALIRFAKEKMSRFQAGSR